MPASAPLPTRGLSSEINVTPLVDVCLVLLIIFMMVTPMLRDEGVLLPQTKEPLPLPESERQLTIAVAEDGSVYLERRKTAHERLLSTLSEIHAATPERKIVVKGDRRLQYKEVRELMRLIQEAGFSRAALSAEKNG